MIIKEVELATCTLKTDPAMCEARLLVHTSNPVGFERPDAKKQFYFSFCGSCEKKCAYRGNTVVDAIWVPDTL